MKKYIFVLFLLCVCGASFAVRAQNAKSTEERVKLDAGQNFLILSTTKIETMEKELDEVAAKGFRVLYGAPTIRNMALFLERAPAGESFNYKILATTRKKTMEKELNEFAVQGFRLLPRTITFKSGFLTAEIVTVMERVVNANVSYEYKLVEAGKETKLQEKIETARADGFEPVTMITLDENVVIMEKRTDKKL